MKLPDELLTKPHMSLEIVDLPAPFFPTMHKISPSNKSKDTLFTTFLFSSYEKLIFSHLKIGGLVIGFGIGDFILLQKLFTDSLMNLRSGSLE